MKEPASGVVIDGKYRLERPLASGGMGSVWVARHLQLGVSLAIKFIAADLAATTDGRMRFEREAKAAAFIQSPHVVHVQDYGVDEGLPYIVMELLNGEDLETRLRRVHHFSLGETYDLLKQSARALRRAHDAGIIHRDLKPRNIFIAHGDDDEDLVKILDFGIAKGTGPNLVGEDTKTGHLMGSPSFMSPEQIRAVKDIDARTDLWSLGVILFRTVTGSLPFPGDELGVVFAKILADPIPLPTEIAPDLPPSIDAFFIRALERDRNRRFQSAREMVDAFAAATQSTAEARRSSILFPEQVSTANATPLQWDPRQAGAGAGVPEIGDGGTEVLKTALMPRRATPLAAIPETPPAGSAEGTLTKPTVLVTSMPSQDRSTASASKKRAVASIVALIAAGTVVTALVSTRSSQNAASAEQPTGAENGRSAAAPESTGAMAILPPPAAPQPTPDTEAAKTNPTASDAKTPPPEPKAPPGTNTRSNGATRGHEPKAPVAKPPSPSPPPPEPASPPKPEGGEDLGF